MLKAPAGRYALVILLGFVVDISVAFGVRQIFAISLSLSAGIGLLTAVAVNYVLLEYWALGRGKFSPKRFVSTYLASVGSLVARVSATYVLSMIPPHGALADLLKLAVAAILSFIINWFLVTRIFFGDSGSQKSGETSPK